MTNWEAAKSFATESRLWALLGTSDKFVSFLGTDHVYLKHLNEMSNIGLGFVLIACCFVVLFHTFLVTKVPQATRER